MGSVKRYLGYYLDNDNVLWSDDHQKIAEDIVKAGVGGALDSKGNFYDLHMESPQPISGVVKWAAAPRYTLILKKDGSVWERNDWAGEKNFSKLDEDVIDMVKNIIRKQLDLVHIINPIMTRMAKHIYWKTMVIIISALAI